MKLAKPADGSRLQWRPAVGAGLVAGAILLIAPRGSPWSAITFFSPIVMGRNVAPLPLPLAWLVHLALAVVYGVIVSAAVVRLTNWRAVLMGGLFGLALYALNYGVVSICFPGVLGAELLVAFTHVVFGLIAAGAYRGLLHRQLSAQPGNQAQ